MLRDTGSSSFPFNFLSMWEHFKFSLDDSDRQELLGRPDE